MTQPVSEVLSAILTDAGLGAFAPENSPFQNGLFSITENYSPNESQEALRLFCRFGGSGWLCTAESKEIEIFQSGAVEPTGLWPRWGELVSRDRQESLHLRYNGSNWTVSIFKEEPGNNDREAIIHQAVLQGKHNMQLYYHVLYELLSVNNLEQYTPTMSRFIGFSQGV